MASMKRAKKKALLQGKAMKVKGGVYRGWYYWTTSGYCLPKHEYGSAWMAPGKDDWHGPDELLKRAVKLYYESEFPNSLPLHKFIEKMFP